jgi:hypothetical protein
MNAIKSVSLSIKTVPSNLANGIFSYLAIIPHRANSPPRGITKLIKYKIWTDKKRFIVFGLYPIDSINIFHLKALTKVLSNPNITDNNIQLYFSSFNASVID